MVSSVTGNPYNSYLGQLQAQGGNATTPQSQSLVSQLLGNGSGPEALSLLQPGSNGNFNPIATLLNGPTTNNALTGLYANLFDSATAAALTQAQENAAPGSAPLTTSSGSGSSTATTNPNNLVENLIQQQTQASIAYNQTLQQNVANTVKSIVQA